MMKNKFIKGGKIGLLMLLVAAVLVVAATASYATTDQTWLKTAGGGSVAGSGNCRFIAVAKGDDSNIMTEDDWNGSNYNDGNGGYVVAGGTGFAKTDSTHWPTGWISGPSDTYAIWVSSIADGQTGTATGTIGATSPNYTTPGTVASQLSLGATNYMAEPGNIKIYAGNGRALLKWDAVTGATQYRIFRGPVTGTSSSIYSKRGTSTSLCYEDTSLTNGTAYYYIVVPMNGSGWYGVHTNQLAITPDATGVPSITPPLNPTSGIVGSSVTITGTGFGAVQGTGAVIFNGVQATTISSWSDGQIVVQVPAGATSGNVYVINSSNKVSGGSSFTVTVPGVPDITSCSPGKYQGDSNTFVTVVGANTNFVQGITTAQVSGSGVTVGTVEVTNTTTAKVYITSVSTSAATSNIILTTTTEVATGEGLFSISAPSLSAPNPTSGYQGDSNLNISVSGTGTHFINGTTTANFGTKITVNSVTVTSTTAATVNITISTDASTVARNFSLITNLGAPGTETVTKTSAFTVNAPSISIFSPNSGAQGSVVPSVTVSGTGTHFQNGVTTVAFSGTGVTGEVTATASPTSETIRVYIQPTAATTARTVTMSTNLGALGTETVTGTFTVTSGLPTITGVSPNSGANDKTTSVTITGTNFTGTTVVSIGAVSVQSFMIDNGTQISAVIQTGLTAGTYDIRVTNPVGTSANTATDNFTVSSPSPNPHIFERSGGIMVAYPNPFNPNDKANPLKMLFGAATGEAVDIYIFDTNGRVIYQSRDIALGPDVTVPWDGETSYGEVVENGLYLIRVVKDGKLVAKGKILVIKK